MNAEQPIPENADGTPLATTGTGKGDNRDDTNDSETGAMLGGVGGALAGAAAGAILGPAGSAVGAVVGALAGAGASGLAVDAVDQVDDDTTLTGLDDGLDREGNIEMTPEMRAAQLQEAKRQDPFRALPSTLEMVDPDPDQK